MPVQRLCSSIGVYLSWLTSFCGFFQQAAAMLMRAETAQNHAPTVCTVEGSPPSTSLMFCNWASQALDLHQLQCHHLCLSNTVTILYCLSKEQWLLHAEFTVRTSKWLIWSRIKRQLCFFDPKESHWSQRFCSDVIKACELKLALCPPWPCIGPSHQTIQGCGQCLWLKWWQRNNQSVISITSFSVLLQF